MKKLLPLFLLVVVCLFAFSGCSDYSPTVFDKDDGYTIEEYDVDVSVGEDFSYLVKERIHINLFEYSHGIIRYIPEQDQVTYQENDKIKKVNFTNDFELLDVDFVDINTGVRKELLKIYEYNEYGYHCVEVKSAYTNYTYKGEFNVFLNYRVNVSGGTAKDREMFYYNVIGNGWDTDINNITYSITFPSPIDSGTPYYIYAGSYPEEQATIVDNKITGSLSFLPYGEALTIKMNLPSGYIAYNKSYTFEIVILILVAITLVLMLFFYIKKRTNERLIQTAEIDIPHDLTPTEAGYLIDEHVDDKDVVALIVYWADKGFIKILQDGNIITLEKTEKPFVGKTHEKLIFRQLFKKSSTVDIGDVANRLNIDSNSTKLLVSTEKGNKHFEGSVNIVRSFLTVLCSLLILLAGINVANLFMDSIGIVIAIVCALGYIILTIAFFNIFRKRYSMKRWKYVLKMFILFILIISMFVGYCLFASFDYDVWFTRIIVSGVSILSLLAGSRMNIRNKEGIKVLGKLLGLKHYIEVVEKDRIKLLAEESPECFFRILPYAYVLNVSDIWIKKFEDLPILATGLESTSVMGGMLRGAALWSIYTSMNATTVSIGQVRMMRMKNNIGSINSHGGGRSGGFGGGFGGGFSGGGHGGGGGGRV